MTTNSLQSTLFRVGWEEFGLEVVMFMCMRYPINNKAFPGNRVFEMSGELSGVKVG